jgi:hypothetical protein
MIKKYFNKNDKKYFNLWREKQLNKMKLNKIK